MILVGTGEEEGQCFPETHSGESDTEYLGTYTDVEKAKIQCLYRLKRYMNQQAKIRARKRRLLMNLIAEG
jgi:hypothetical protein